MTRILLIGDSFLGAIPFRAADLEGDSWFALERVRALACELRPEVLIHAGGIFGTANRATQVRFHEWAEHLGWEAGIQVVLTHDPNDAVDVSATCADFDLLLPTEGPIEIRGVEYVHVASDAADAPGRVVIGSGIVEGTYGSRAATLAEQAWRRPQCRMVALAGVPRPQMLSKNALTAGQLTPADIGDLAGSTATIVDVDDDGIRLVHRYRLPSRPRRVMRMYELDFRSVDLLIKEADALGVAAIEQDREAMPEGIPGGPLLRIEFFTASSDAAASLERYAVEVADRIRAAGATVADVRICRVGQ